MPRLHISMLLAVLALAGCNTLFGDRGDGGGGGDEDAAQVGFSGPSLLVTVGGLRLGPAAPDPGSFVAQTDTRDLQTGRTLDSTLRISASAAETGASCDLLLQRFGDGIAPISAGPYQIETATGARSPEGTLQVVGSVRVVIPQGGFQCSGSACDDGVLSLTALGPDHAEGFFAGTLSSDVGAGYAMVVCSFYLPLSPG